jgi:hypothetical protein
MGAASKGVRMIASRDGISDKALTEIVVPKMGIHNLTLTLLCSLASIDEVVHGLFALQDWPGLFFNVIF